LEREGGNGWVGRKGNAKYGYEKGKCMYTFVALSSLFSAVLIHQSRPPKLAVSVLN
jgi:hypothetical protein